MKKIVLTLLFPLITFAQVGIGTTNPQQDLHVTGTNSTIRIDGFNSVNNPNNDGVHESKVYVNSNGNLALKPTTPLVPVDISNGSLIPTPITINQTGYSLGAVSTSLANGTFNISSPKTVKCLFSVGISNITRTSSASTLNDDKSRIIMCYLFIDGIQAARGSYSYTSHSTSSMNGTLTLSGSVFKHLTSGNHTWEIRGGVYGYDNAFKASFGGNVLPGTDFLQIIEFN